MRSQGAKRFKNQYRLDKKQTITDDCEERKILMKILSIFYLLITASICFAGEPGGQAGNGIGITSQVRPLKMLGNESPNL